MEVFGGHFVPRLPTIRLALTATLVVWLTADLPGRADVISHTSRDAFNAATTNRVLTTFDGLSGGNTFQFYGTLTQNGTTFVGTTGLNPASRRKKCSELRGRQEG
jgi:hypothetical protein